MRDAIVFGQALETGEEADWMAATKVPIEVAARAGALTDVDSAMYLCKSAVQAAITCIQPNLTPIKNAETRKELSARVWALQ